MVFYDFQLEVGNRLHEVYDIFTEKLPRIGFAKNPSSL